MDRILPGIIALIAGGVLAIAFLVPFVAISYRRRGGLTPGRTLAWLALLVWILGVQAYTLLPIPNGDIVCAGVELDPLQAVYDILDPANAAYGPLRNPAVQQLVLNVALFLPWGVLARMLWRRGIVVATLSGFAISLLVEVTQLTGVWGLFSCAYRLFDTGDLLANTVGALLGSLIALPFVRRGEQPAAPASRGITFPRRVIGMLSDVLVVVGTSVVVGIAVNVVQYYVFEVDRTRVDSTAADAAGAIAAFLLTGAVVLATGSTVGEWAVRLRGVDTRSPVALWRTVRFLTGIGGYQLIVLLPGMGGLTGTAFVVATLIVAWRSDQHRGLAHLASGMRLETT